MMLIQYSKYKEMKIKVIIILMKKLTNILKNKFICHLIKILCKIVNFKVSKIRKFNKIRMNLFKNLILTKTSVILKKMNLLKMIIKILINSKIN
jgi:hypothetical protein